MKKSYAKDELASCDDEGFLYVVLPIIPDSILTALAAKLIVAIDLIEQGQSYQALGVLHRLTKLMPKPSAYQIDLARKESSYGTD